MIRSMTGFGAAEMTTEERRISIEMRAVNNRYLDFNIRMPKRYIPLEGKITAARSMCIFPRSVAAQERVR